MAYEINLTRYGAIVVTFLWIPPEDPSQVYILSRVALPESMAKHMGDDLLASVKDLRRRSQETTSHRKKETEETVKKVEDTKGSLT